MDQHDVVSALKELERSLGRTPTRQEFLAKHPKLEALMARMGGFSKCLTAAGLQKEFETVQPKVLLLDIEATRLEANVGFTLCIADKWLGAQDVNLISIRDDKKRFAKDVTDDRSVLQRFEKRFLEADVIVTWYGTYFDIPFLQTRRMLHDMKPLPNVPHVDGWKIARFRLKFSSNRLDTVSKAIARLDQKKEEKTYLDNRHWMRAAAGYVDGLKYVEEHCVQDVKVLEQVYRAIGPFGTSLPNVSKLGDTRREGCPHCNSSQLLRQKVRLTARGRMAQYQCADCGHYFTLPESKERFVVVRRDEPSPS